MAQLMFNIAGERPTNICTANPNVPPSIGAFLDRVIAEDPDSRFQNGEAFSAARRTVAGGAVLSTADAASGGIDFEL